MIRVELLGRQRPWSPWSKALLSALVVCGGLYGLHLFFPALTGSLFSADSARSPAAQQEQEAASSPAVQREFEPAPSPIVQEEGTLEPAAQQEDAASSVGQQKSPAQRDTGTQEEATPSPAQEDASSLVAQQESAAQQETTSSPAQEDASRSVGPQKSAAQQEATPSPAQEDASSFGGPQKSAAQQEATPSPEIQQGPGQEIESKPAAQQDTVPSSVAQETASSPVQDPVFQPEATPAPTPSQRSTACLQIMRIDEQVPAGIRVASLKCDSSGEYWLEGTSPSYKVLRDFRLRLQALPSRVSFSTWREERTLRFAFQGRFAERATPPLTALAPDQVEQFFGEIAGWAAASGLDSLSVHGPIHSRAHQRQKLRGIGSPQQIDAFLQQLQQAEAASTLGEILLMPVKSDERGWVKARLYAAVDIIVGKP